MLLYVDFIIHVFPGRISHKNKQQVLDLVYKKIELQKATLARRTPAVHCTHLVMTLMSNTERWSNQTHKKDDEVRRIKSHHTPKVLNRIIGFALDLYLRTSDNMTKWSKAPIQKHDEFHGAGHPGEAEAESTQRNQQYDFLKRETAFLQRPGGCRSCKKVTGQAHIRPKPAVGDQLPETVTHSTEVTDPPCHNLANHFRSKGHCLLSAKFQIMLCTLSLWTSGSTSSQGLHTHVGPTSTTMCGNVWIAIVCFFATQLHSWSGKINLRCQVRRFRR